MKLNTGKLAIPAEVPHIWRQRLLDAVGKNLDTGCATIINGRAGTGKTILATDFVRCYDRAIAWYKVDATDAKLTVFIEYLIATVERERCGFGVKTLSHIQDTMSESHISKLVEAFVYDLEKEAKPLILALDDLHLIYDADWLSPFFYRLLSLLPTEVHLLILGRGLPPAPLWRLRSKQRLLVINEPMLAFTEAEAVELFSVYGLSGKQARQAMEHTGGRAADLHAIAMREGRPYKSEGNFIRGLNLSPN